MRRWQRWSGSAILGLAGCMPWNQNRSQADWFNPSFSRLTSAAAEDQCVLQSILLDQPAGDPYLTHELWGGLQSRISPELTALLAENGLRIGVISGNPPAEFLKRLTSESNTIQPTQSATNLGTAKLVPVNGPLPRLQLSLWGEIGGEEKRLEILQAECALKVTATRPEAGCESLQLQLEPILQHGTKQTWLRPSADNTGFSWLDGKSTEQFEKLAASVTLAPNQYLVIGPTAEPIGKLGGAYFIHQAEGRSRMRVLVLRTWRPGTATEPMKPTAPGTVAAQARQSVARGQQQPR
ncbi:MAG: hypothetical protein ACRCZF_27820 [Gemmataceae bacterium]